MSNIKDILKKIKMSVSRIFVISTLITATNAFAEEGAYAYLKGEYITTNNITELNNASEFTFEIQIYLLELSSWTNIIGQTDSPTNRVSLQTHKGKLYCIVANDENTLKFTPSVVLNTDQWHTIAMTYDASSSAGVKLYVDGKSVRLVASGKEGLPNKAPETKANFIVGNAKYKGLVDNVRVWSRSLSSNTLAQWHDKTLNSSHPDYESLILYWDFEKYRSAKGVKAALKTKYIGKAKNLKLYKLE